MNAERFRQIEQLYYRALELNAPEREVFLTEVCGTDVKLRHEVQSLLAAHAEAGSFIAGFALEDHALGLAALDDQTLHEGQSMAPAMAMPREVNQYLVVSLLGKGGMGEVWLAEDTRLHRKVALKLLPASFADDAARVRRFAQEAVAISALNHPNIITLFDHGHAGADYFMATEYVDGQTLHSRLREGPPMSSAEAADIAIQVCQALAVAHEAGIIHRDIKTENLMIRRDGYVKVLDFGLAQLDVDLVNGAQSSLTHSGMVIGTASYMSPEQSRGEKVDARTDIFSLGIVLYEMLEGRKPFPGATIFEVIGAILNREPEPMTLASAEWQRVVQKALHKDRAERYQTIQEVLIDLKQLRLRADAPTYDQRDATSAFRPESSTNEISAALDTASGERLFQRGNYLRAALLAAISLGLAGGGYAIYRMKSRPALPAFSPLTITKPNPLTTFSGAESTPAFSPDGKSIAFSYGGEKNENLDLYIKEIDGERTLRLTNHPANDNDPAWSPDGASLAFTRRTQSEGGIYVLPTGGGAERKLTSLSPQRPGGIAGSELSWSPDGTLLAFGDRESSQSPLRINLLNLATGERRVLTNPAAGSLGDFLPAFSPDAKTIAFVRNPPASDSRREVMLIPVAGGEARQVTKDMRRINSLAWLGNDHELLFSGVAPGEDTSIGLVQMDVNTLQYKRLTGPDAILMGGVYDRQNRRLCYVKADYDVDVMRLGLKGTAVTNQPPEKLIGSTKIEFYQRYSPDGTKLVYQTALSGNETLWMCDSDGQNQRQLISDPKFSPGWPNWSPDSKQISFTRYLDGKAAIFALHLETGEQRKLVQNNFNNSTPSWSRDGNWIYFSSDRTGESQIYKVPVSGGEPVQITKHGGIEPHEAMDGKFLVYVRKRQTPGLWRIDLTTGAETLLTDTHKAGYWSMWDVTQTGIFFGTNVGPSQSLIEFYPFATGRISTVAKLNSSFSAGSRGLSVSPDGRWLTYLHSQVKSDLLLAEVRN